MLVQAADSIMKYGIFINGKAYVIMLKPKMITRSYRVYCGHSHHLSYQIKSWFRKGKPLKYKGFSESVTERGIIWVGEFNL